MSLRWIYENLEPPNCDEESSDIDDSCTDASYDSDLLDDDANNNCKPTDKLDRHARNNATSRSEKRVRVLAPPQPPRLEWDPERITDNPFYESFKLKLLCRSGYFIGITSTGRAKGFSSDSNDAYVQLIASPISTGVVRLQSVETGHYLAFNSTGHLYGEKKASKDNTEWEPWKIGDYDAFRSHKYSNQNWWLGIKRNGRHQPGPTTAWGQKSIQFMSIRFA